MLIILIVLIVPAILIIPVILVLTGSLLVIRPSCVVVRIAVVQNFLHSMIKQRRDDIRPAIIMTKTCAYAKSYLPFRCFVAVLLSKIDSYDIEVTKLVSEN